MAKSGVLLNDALSGANVFIYAPDICPRLLCIYCKPLSCQCELTVIKHDAFLVHCDSTSRCLLRYSKMPQQLRSKRRVHVIQHVYLQQWMDGESVQYRLDSLGFEFYDFST